MRKRAGVVVALVAALTLTGCAEIGSLADKAQIDLAMQDLSTQLDDLAGIELAYTAHIAPDYSYSVSAQATAARLSTEQLADAAVLVNEAFASGVFVKSPVMFTLEAPDGPSLTMNVFDLPDAQLRDDLDLAAAAGEAFGAPPSISFMHDEEGSVVRSIGLSAPGSAPDWEALRALHEGQADQVFWQLGGLSVYDEFPSAEVTDLVDAINLVVPLGTDALPWAFVDWYGTGLFVSLIGEDVDVADPTASSLWPQAVQLATLLSGSAVDGRGLMFYGEGGPGTASVYFGACADPLDLSDYDAVLATALAAAGVADVHSGQCLTAQE